MVGPRAVTVAFSMAVVALTWAAAISAAASAIVESGAGPASAELHYAPTFDEPFAPMMVAPMDEPFAPMTVGGGDATFAPTVGGGGDPTPAAPMTVDPRGGQPHQQPRKFRHEASSIRILYQIGVSIHTVSSARAGFRRAGCGG